MHAHLEALLDAFIRSREPEPADLISSLQRLPEPGALPSPWDTWTLIGLTRHHKRQLWLKNCASRIRYEMNELHDRVMMVKNIVPPEPLQPLEPHQPLEPTEPRHLPCSRRIKRVRSLRKSLPPFSPAINNRMACSRRHG